MTSINIEAAAEDLSQLIDRAVAGEEIIIVRAGKPLARLTALAPNSVLPRRVLGRLGNGVSVPDDFDTMGQEEIIRMFEGDPLSDAT